MKAMSSAPIQNGELRREMMDQPLTLGDIVTNSELARRSSRAPEYQAENQALEILAQTLAHSPERVLQKLVEVAQQLCRADSAGISLLEEHGGEQVFRWEALAGVLRDHVNGTMPRNASPCGITIDRDATQLMYLPERFFPALKIEPPIVEALLVPFHVDNQPVGTVWVVTHTDHRKFDKEDERIIKTLANFAAAGWQLWKARGTAEAATISTRHDLVDSIERENQLQEQLQHSRSIGMPAVAIAHDFNNLLHIIQSYATIMEINLEDPKALAQDLDMIKQAVKEGTALTQQLLTGARKNKAQFDLISINGLIMTLPKWLDSTVPKTVTIDLALDPTDPHIEADASQLNQILLNLCVNARDAMGDTGTLQLSTRVVAGSQLRDQYSRAEDRDYVCIAVKDTGQGMDENVREHIFEPFFTTKQEGKGTGLGLSIVYGTVMSHHGFIDVETQPGHGSTFHIYLPVAH
jgi:signal transduction histidine kinase